MGSDIVGSPLILKRGWTEEHRYSGLQSRQTDVTEDSTVGDFVRKQR